MASSDYLGPPARTPLAFELDGETFTLPELDTRTWLDALTLEPLGCWWALIPLRLAGNGPERIWDRLRDGDDPFDLDDCEHVATRVLTAAAGTDFWAATRLAATAWGNWMVFDGWSYSRGLDPLSEPIGRVLAACYTWQAQMCEKKTEATRLDHEVWAGPPATTAAGHPRAALPTWASEDREIAAFEQLTGAFT